MKVAVLRVTNAEARPRRLTVTTYVEWTLGVHREHTQRWSELLGRLREAGATISA